MLYQKKKLANGATLGVWKMEENEEELLAFFDEKRQEYATEIARFRYPARRLEFLAARLLLKDLTGYENSIVYDSNRRPSLVDSKVEISISHTTGYVSVIAHPSACVGIDIEQRKERIVRLKHKFLSPEELENTESSCEVEHLLLQWSAKEAMYKMMREREVDFISHLHILPFTPASEGTCYGKETKSARQRNFIFDYQIDNDFVLVWGRLEI